jgi:hypothetical protein
MTQGTRVLEHLNRLCAGHEGQLIQRIRLHPLDRDALRSELRELGVRDPITGLPRVRIPDELHPFSSMYGVPMIGDETLLDGPVIDWMPLPHLHAELRLR